MNIFVKTVLILLLVTMITPQIYSEDFLKDDEYKRVEKKRKIKILTDYESEQFFKKFKQKKGGETALLIIGSLAAATGLSLFIHDKTGGENSPYAQYYLMFGGLLSISSGIFINPWSYKTLELSRFYEKYTENIIVDEGTVIDERAIYYKAQHAAKKRSAERFRNAGIGLLAISIPTLALSIYSSYEFYKNNKGSPEDFFIYFYAFTPSALSIAGGIALLAVFSRYKQLSTEPSILTLNSIAPIIDPVSKTYGLSLGFSF